MASHKTKIAYVEFFPASWKSFFSCLQEKEYLTWILELTNFKTGLDSETENENPN